MQGQWGPGQKEGISLTVEGPAGDGAIPAAAVALAATASANPNIQRRFFNPCSWVSAPCL